MPFARKSTAPRSSLRRQACSTVIFREVGLVWSTCWLRVSRLFAVALLFLLVLVFQELLELELQSIIFVPKICDVLALLLLLLDVWTLLPLLIRGNALLTRDLLLQKSVGFLEFINALAQLVVFA